MKNEAFDIKNLEKRLNIVFNNISLLNEALTHSSYINQHKEKKHNERLEFLGDSVLQICISEYLYKNFPDKSEGELTRLRSLIVCENSLYEISIILGLGKYLRMSKGEELTGGRDRISILADSVEAVIAAIYLDRGIQEAKKFIMHNFSNIIDRAINNDIILDYKTRLQEVLQQKGETLISYNLLKFEGPPHRRKFYTEVIIDKTVYGTGSGYSKKESEQNAAKAALCNMEVIYE
ncbi:ribonuclease III [Clostridiales bacterium oral taxon 876 str. F0540]|nr:ribonuclease III [Clostridiales bacterium oral taxon 876 str. F0540]